MTYTQKQKTKEAKKSMSRIGTVDLTTAAALRKPVIHVIRESRIETEEEEEVVERQTYTLCVDSA